MQVSTRKIQTVEQGEQSDEQDDFFVGTIDVQTMKNVHIVTTETQNEKDKLTESLKINNKNVTFKLDTGAACNVIPNNVFKSLETQRKLQKSTCHLITYSGHKMSPVGQVQLTFTYRNQKDNIQFQVVDGNVPALLGPVKS